MEKVSRELYESHQSLLSAYNSLKDQKAQLLHQEKLASIGQLSACIAHEINNPTSYVLTNIGIISRYFEQIQSYCAKLELLASDSSLSVNDKLHTMEEQKKQLNINYLTEDASEAISESKEGLERVKNIVANLKGFARPDSTEKELISLNECIDTTLQFVRADILGRADLRLELADLPNIHGRRGEISQVILNLLTNALDAIDDHGEIHIQTKQVQDGVSLTVTDNGSGIDDEHLNIVFDPFFSTKEMGKGTGLGLSISYGIIHQHGGTMRVASKKGHGTTFHISLPLH